MFKVYLIGFKNIVYLGFKFLNLNIYKIKFVFSIKCIDELNDY